jgi:exodeoxyribonuclease VII large subunit
VLVKEASVKSQGNLYAEFEKLKAKLSAEGLFDNDRKLPLPKFPSKIGVITSPTGAAVRDILSVLRRRSANLQVIIAPVLVQGEGSKEQIKEALENFNKFEPKVDVILLGRGGGSIEDLWSFNEDLVVRAVAASKIPIISCVGHETDFTLTDFAASLRAPTPSAAAELVVENSQSIREHLLRLNKMLVQALDIKYEKLNARYLRAIESKVFKEPQTIFLKKEQLLDDLYERLTEAAEEKIKKTQDKLKLNIHRLNLLSPKATLKRGYAIVRRTADGKVVQSSLKGERLNVQTAQDTFEVETV